MCSAKGGYSYSRVSTQDPYYDANQVPSAPSSHPQHDGDSHLNYDCAQQVQQTYDQAPADPTHLHEANTATNTANPRNSFMEYQNGVAQWWNHTRTQANQWYQLASQKAADYGLNTSDAPSWKSVFKLSGMNVPPLSSLISRLQTNFASYKKNYAIFALGMTAIHLLFSLPRYLILITVVTLLLYRADRKLQRDNNNNNSDDSQSRSKPQRFLDKLALVVFGFSAFLLVAGLSFSLMFPVILSASAIFVHALIRDSDDQQQVLELYMDTGSQNDIECQPDDTQVHLIAPPSYNTNNYNNDPIPLD